MPLRIDERDELLLNRLLDGELTEQEAAALRARMEVEPALQAAHAQNLRIHGLLTARAADQAAPRWDAFYAQVMSQVETKDAHPVHRALRFPVWLRFAAPLAAAACVAWLVFSQVLPDMKSTGQPATSGRIHVAINEPPPAATGTLLVRYQRPAANAPSGDAAVNVAYQRSAQMDEQIRKIDQARQKQPSWRLYMVHTGSPAPMPMMDYLDLPL